jgi:hypothetical protein
MTKATISHPISAAIYFHCDILKSFRDVCLLWLATTSCVGLEIKSVLANERIFCKLFEQAKFRVKYVVKNPWKLSSVQTFTVSPPKCKSETISVM